MSTVRPVPPPAPVAGALVLLWAALGACGAGEAPTPGASGASASTSAGPAEVNQPASTKAKGGAKTGSAAEGKGTKGVASAQLAYQTAFQLLLKGDPEKALAEFQRATELDPGMSEAYFEFGKLQVHLSSQNIGSQARDLDILDVGLKALEKARELEPSNDDYWYWVGKAHYIRNDSERALGELLKAVELNPKHFLAWKTLGRVQRDAADIEAARASFAKAIEIAPEEAGTHFQLGLTLEALGDLPGARAAYERSIELRPTEPEVFGRLTQVCARLGDAVCEERARAGMEAWMEYDRKLQRRRHEVSQRPGDALALQRLGEMFFVVGRWEEAGGWFLRSIHIDPTNALTHLYCGIVRRNLKDYVSATNHLKEAEFLAPDNLDPKLELLRLYAEAEDEASAKALVGAVESAAAAEGESLWALAEVCQEVGRTEDATRLFAEARALGVTAPPDLAGRAPDEGG